LLTTSVTTKSKYLVIETISKYARREVLKLMKDSLIE